MLKNIPNIISPELLSVLHKMGHSDTIVIGDGNFPGASVAKKGDAEYIRLDGHGVSEILDAILTLIPTDAYVDTPMMLMEKMEVDADLSIPIWDEYKTIAEKHEIGGGSKIGSYERFEFYKQAEKAYCVIQSSESAIYANIIIQKGVIK